MRTVFVSMCFVAICCHVVLSTEDLADDYQDRAIERPVGRSYSLTTCDYKTQIGYSCLNCNRALHCYIGNNAIIVDCYGLFRYCRDGRCSRFQGEKCTDSRQTTLGPYNTTIETDSANVVTSSEGTTKFMTDETAITTDEEKATTIRDNSPDVIKIDEKATTKSESSTTVTPSDDKATTKSDSSSTVTLIDKDATTKSDVSTTYSSNVV